MVTSGAPVNVDVVSGGGGPRHHRQCRGHLGCVEAGGVDAMLCLEADHERPEHRGQHVGLSHRSHEAFCDPGCETPRQPFVCFAGTGPHGAGHLGIARGTKPQLAFEQQEPAGLVAGVGHHIDRHGAQPVLDRGRQLELGGDDSDERVRPFVEQRQEESLLRPEMRVDGSRSSSRFVADGVHRHGVDAALGEQRGGGVEETGASLGLALLLGPCHPVSSDPDLDNASYLNAGSRAVGDGRRRAG